MKKRVSVFILWMLCSLAQAPAQETDPFAEDSDAESTGLPERAIAKLPDAITATRTEEGKWRYVITGIYTYFEDRYPEEASGRKEVPNPFTDEEISLSISRDERESTYAAFFPEGTKVSLNFTELECTITTQEELNLSEFADIIDQLAWLCGEIPYWPELEARDAPKSDEFDLTRYQIQKATTAFPPSLAWFRAGNTLSGSVTSPFAIYLDYPGSLRIDSTTAHCIDYNRFAVRILDGHGRLVWMDDTTLSGDVSFAVADLDGDLRHEVLIQMSNHKESSNLIIRPAEDPDQ